MRKRTADLIYGIDKVSNLIGSKVTYVSYSMDKGYDEGSMDVHFSNGESITLAGGCYSPECKPRGGMSISVPDYDHEKVAYREYMLFFDEMDDSTFTGEDAWLDFLTSELESATFGYTDNRFKEDDFSKKRAKDNYLNMVDIIKMLSEKMDV